MKSLLNISILLQVHLNLYLSTFKIIFPSEITDNEIWFYPNPHGEGDILIPQAFLIHISGQFSPATHFQHFRQFINSIFPFPTSPTVFGFPSVFWLGNFDDMNAGRKV